MDTTCRNTHIALVQCAYADLAYRFVQAANIGSRETDCLALKMKIVDKYLGMMYCYKTLTTDLTYAEQFDVSAVDYSDIILIQAAIGALATTYYTSYDAAEGYLYVYSYAVGAVHADVDGAIVGVIGSSLTYTDVVDSPDFLLDLWNCITYDEFCNIINHAYALTEE